MWPSFCYFTTKVAKVRPGFDDRPKHPSVHIKSSSHWIAVLLLRVMVLCKIKRLMHDFSIFLNEPALTPNDLFKMTF